MDTSRFGHVVLRTSRFCVLALIVVGGVLVATLTSFSTSLTSASAVASWSTPKAVDAQSPYGLKSVSCVAANFCIAVDSNGNFLSYNGISWSTPQNIDSSHNFYSVSCVTKDFCVAVDYANVLVFNGSAWSAPQRIDFQPADNLDSVSCSSTIYCMAVSSMGFAFTMSGTAWSGPGLISSNGNLFGVSCPPSSGAESCNIVGGSGGSNSGQAFVYNGNTSSGVGVVSNGSLFGISCPSEIFCAAVDLSSDVLFKNGATWSSPNVIDAGSGMVSVSCPSVAFCVAVDKNGNALTYNGTSWSSPSAIDAGFWLTSVSCPTSTFCAAVDNYGRVAVHSEGSSTTTSSTPVTTTSSTSSTGGSMISTKTVLSLSKRSVAHGHEQTVRGSVVVTPRVSGPATTGVVRVNAVFSLWGNVNVRLCVIKLSRGRGSCNLPGSALNPMKFRGFQGYGSLAVYDYEITAHFVGSAKYRASTSQQKTLFVS
jgi:hypothetical protein